MSTIYRFSRAWAYIRTSDSGLWREPFGPSLMKRWVWSVDQYLRLIIKRSYRWIDIYIERVIKFGLALGYFGLNIVWLLIKKIKMHMYCLIVKSGDKNKGSGLEEQMGEYQSVSFEDWFEIKVIRFKAMRFLCSSLMPLHDDWWLHTSLVLFCSDLSFLVYLFKAQAIEEWTLKGKKMQPRSGSTRGKVNVDDKPCCVRTRSWCTKTKYNNLDRARQYVKSGGPGLFQVYCTYSGGALRHYKADIIKKKSKRTGQL